MLPKLYEGRIKTDSYRIMEEKGRITIPPALRNMLKSKTDKIFMGIIEREQKGLFLMPEDKVNSYKSPFISKYGWLVTMDKKGRIRIPKYHSRSRVLFFLGECDAPTKGPLEEANIKADETGKIHVVLFRTSETVEIWSKDVWERIVRQQRLCIYEGIRNSLYEIRLLDIFLRSDKTDMLFIRKQTRKIIKDAKNKVIFIIESLSRCFLATSYSKLKEVLSGKWDSKVRETDTITPLDTSYSLPVTLYFFDTLSKENNVWIVFFKFYGLLEPDEIKKDEIPKENIFCLFEKISQDLYLMRGKHIHKDKDFRVAKVGALTRRIFATLLKYHGKKKIILQRE